MRPRDKGGGKRERIEAGASVVSVTPQSAAPPDTRVDGRNEPLGPKQRERAGRVGGVGGIVAGDPSEESPRAAALTFLRLCRNLLRGHDARATSLERDTEPRWVNSARPLPHWYSGKSALARLGSPPSPRGGARAALSKGARAIAFVAHIRNWAALDLFTTFIRFGNPSAGGISQ